MVGSSAPDPVAYLSASGVAAIVNFPLWKAATIGQSGFKTAADTLYAKLRLLFGPPYKGVAATMFGMTWARAAIFYCSDSGKGALKAAGASTAVATSLPPVLISTLVQIINQPIVRGTITIQDPSSPHPNLGAALTHIYRQRGTQGLWHGTSASVLKTVPKYVTAVWVKDAIQDILPPPTVAEGEPGHRSQVLCRSAAKSIAAGTAGAALTNPLDVVRNEMFKTEDGPLTTVRRLLARDGLAFLHRGMARNLVAVAVPIGMTIFLTDAFVEMRRERRFRLLPGVDAPKTSSRQQVGGGGGSERDSIRTASTIESESARSRARHEGFSSDLAPPSPCITPDPGQLRTSQLRPVNVSLPVSMLLPSKEPPSQSI